ncbi:heterokaryon incompatibility protein-domain-containing protein [Xylariomycetidae sp. FL2044]|nr:heterokaryon incompatibility protein-domain-containing protein [Xylariomycetidae sp. FL2044]
MRLLHAKTLELETFLGDDVPPYAILSHRWGGPEEVTFKDMANGTSEARAGWSKVDNFCKRATIDGWDYVWMDSCCIDKADPTELGEAINSMFRWYEDAQVCYAYLEDVPPRYSPFAASKRYDRQRKVPWKWYFRSSKWFTRGWTLQELLAPSFLIFLDEKWHDIGTREAWAAEITIATAIEERQLHDFRSCSIATKLSWAAHRRTTRIEDRAYSLLGLLGVNLPLIYSEGPRAFIRLQHELIQNHNDESIFAWGTTRPRTGHAYTTGGKADILARSPEDFASSNGISAWPFDKRRHGFVMTNAGLSMNAELFIYRGGEEEKARPLYALLLNCTAKPLSSSSKTPVSMFLRSLDADFPSSSSSPSSSHLTLFERAARIFRDWGDVNHSDWESIDRRDMTIAHRSFGHHDDNDEGTSTRNHIVKFAEIADERFLYAPPLFFHRVYGIWSVKPSPESEGLFLRRPPEVARSSFSLAKNEAMLRSVLKPIPLFPLTLPIILAAATNSSLRGWNWFPHWLRYIIDVPNNGNTTGGNTTAAATLIVIKHEPRAPRFGIWKYQNTYSSSTFSSSPDDDDGKVNDFMKRLLGSRDHEPYPTAAEYSEGGEGAMRIAVRPRSLRTGESVRQFVVTIKTERSEEAEAGQGAFGKFLLGGSESSGLGVSR